MRLSPEEVHRRIVAARKALGSRLVILGHHYQRDEVIQFADFRGDSLRLSREAAARKDADYIVFCGVHFMAESADILSAPHQKVILPDLTAGCSMADMACIEDVEDCWEQLRRATSDTIVPVTYINSSAALKAFCGRNGGVVCTSSNCARVLAWAWERGPKVLFFPDQHLGRNTAWKMGVPLDAMALWDPEQERGGVDGGRVGAARIILWRGHCAVHQRFTVAQIEKARRAHPDCRIIVHPECPFDVVRAADDSGSTEYIIKTVSGGRAGSVWGVGTERHLVNRLANELPDRTVFSLDDCICVCSTMYRIDPEHLLWVLENLVDGRVVNQITVDEETARWAIVALDRMLAIG
jgi:quinolinate synthase